MKEHYLGDLRERGSRLAGFALLAAAATVYYPSEPRPRKPSEEIVMALADREVERAQEASGEVLTATKTTDEAGNTVFEVMPEALEHPGEL